MKKRKALALIMCLMMCVSVLAACGGSGDSGDSSGGSSIVIAKSEDATTMDPARQTTSGGIQMMSAVGEGLVRVTPDGKDVEAGLAESWEVSEDGLTYTFTLRDGLKFSDGNDITLEDWQKAWLIYKSRKNSEWITAGLKEIADITSDINLKKQIEYLREEESVKLEAFKKNDGILISAV